MVGTARAVGYPPSSAGVVGGTTDRATPTRKTTADATSSVPDPAAAMRTSAGRSGGGEASQPSAPSVPPATGSSVGGPRTTRARAATARCAAIAAASSAAAPAVAVATRKIFGPETFFAIDVHCPPGGLVFRGNLRGPPGPTVDALNRRLTAVLGHDRYTACLVQGDEPVAAAAAPGRVVPAPGGATKPMVLIVPSRRAMEVAGGGGCASAPRSSPPPRS